MRWRIDWTERELAGIPVLIARPKGQRPAGAVLWYHSWSNDKHKSRPQLTRLARAGLLAIGVDAVGHGGRPMPKRVFRPETRVGRESFFFRVVAETAAEVPKVVDALLAEGLAERVALGGISMGGEMAYGAFAREPRLCAMATVLGNPCWPRPDSPHLVLEQTAPPRPMLSLTARHDTVCPPRYTRQLHEKLAPHYRDVPEALAYHEYPKSAHRMRKVDKDDALGRITSWLAHWTNE
jgi:dienelactone hydrolase